MSPPLSVRVRALRLTRRHRRALAGLLAVLVGLVAWAVWPERTAYTRHEQMITVWSGPAGNEPVALDTTFYLPREASPRRKVPTVLLAHGFGGSKHTVRADAEELAELGYAVLTFTARGFGRSGGQIHLNHPDYEVRDAQRLLDWLAARPEVRTDADGDPRVGVVGGSYGGALALLLAAYDPRVDAIIPMITWNDLARAFLPESTGKSPVDGVFKRGWAGLFFGNGAVGPGGAGGLGSLGDPGPGAADAGTTSGDARRASASPPPQPSVSPSGASPAPTAAPGEVVAPDTVAGDPQCGRFARDVCEAYLEVARTGRATKQAVALLRRASPASVVHRITAPTLLIQGTVDTLFPLSEADATARALAARGTPVRVAWFTGGHDGGSGPDSDRDRLKRLTAQWLSHYVKGEGPAPDTSFTWSRIAGFTATDRGLVASGYRFDAYPGLGGVATARVTVAGPPQLIANPPAGNPAALSALPMTGRLSSLLTGVAADLPGQHARFESAPLDRPIDVVGAPTVTIRAASPTGEAVLFVKLYDVDPDGNETLPSGLIAPVRLTGLPTEIAQSSPVTVTLPAIVHRIEAGHRLRIVVATADQGYATPVDPVVYAVAPGEGGQATVVLPTVPGEPIPTAARAWRWLLVGLIALLAVAVPLVTLALRRRRQRVAPRPEHADTPLVVSGLRKEYPGGFVAVSRVDFTVERNQVVGLLGPNGAGKTTTLRMLLGLTQPSAGEIVVFGHRLTPGAPVLSRIGALVEGPGFLPHLSGLDNLRFFWQATGRPMADARLDQALEIAGLGASVHRKVKTYSHGMKQRLAIAQAMLGLPELLILDEPTDGLDPPQIAEMRRVLKRYATDGRAVLVSSHLLAEVEQVCTHVVVLSKGTVVASGPVAELIGESTSVHLDVSDVDAARTVLRRMSAVRSVTLEGSTGLVVELAGMPRRELVAELVRAGIGVDRVTPRRRLEDAFLALVGDSTRGSGDR